MSESYKKVNKLTENFESVTTQILEKTNIFIQDAQIEKQHKIYYEVFDSIK